VIEMRTKLMVALFVAVFVTAMSVTADAGCCATGAACCNGGSCCD